MGNRLTIDEGSYTFQEAGLIYGVSSADSDILASDPTYYYDYDANGSVIKRTLKTDSTTYRLYYYDWEQKLSKVEDYVSSSLDKTIQYTYDPMGNLIKRVEDGSSTTTYVQDLNAGLPVVLIEETSSYTAKYTYGKDRLKVSRSGEYYYFYDGLGSTRTITDTSGTVKARYVYDVYGKPLSSESYEDASVAGQPFLFTGELYDADTEHIYLRARWYDPNTGRFLTRDTYQGEWEDPSSLHRHAYCGNDPVNLNDPTGHFTFVDLTVTMSIQVTLRESLATAQIMVLNIVNFAANVYNFIREPSLKNAGFLAIDLLCSATFLKALNIGRAAAGFKVVNYIDKVKDSSTVVRTARFVSTRMSRYVIQNKISNFVIGAMEDLKPQNLRKGESTLLDWLPKMEGWDDAAYWARNKKVLEEVMSLGLPIRDMSWMNKELIKKPWRFIWKERKLLEESGWHLVQGWWIKG